MGNLQTKSLSSFKMIEINNKIEIKKKCETTENLETCRKF